MTVPKSKLLSTFSNIGKTGIIFVKPLIGSSILLPDFLFSHCGASDSLIDVLEGALNDLIDSFSDICQQWGRWSSALGKKHEIFTFRLVLTRAP